ncbi:MAG: heavy metal-responsive transcriptional regulator [Nitrospirae bacterium]|nr:MAG: heavy metal-responsive transcriptional regulator [Nitrospirota bacterium]
MMTISQLAKAANVNLQTLRFYERRRLLVPTLRSAAGYRLYTQDDLRRLVFIKRAQALGFTLKEIAELLDLRVRAPEACQAMQQKARAKLVTVEEKVKHLQALARTLRALLQNCTTDLSSYGCPILQSLEEMEPSLASKPRVHVSNQAVNRRSSLSAS